VPDPLLTAAAGRDTGQKEGNRKLDCGREEPEIKRLVRQLQLQQQRRRWSQETNPSGQGLM
jgi:hypothetical protein